jgi:hypothetical protein|tara:strand:+ start:3548 stop:5668 length:2121 start_codon:yes stop_codon:yes gene_type:complete
MQTQQIKGNLARLLATENLVVEHRKVPTASFDVDRRVLTLPMWDKASGIVYDMLVGHEVGHALFTPNEDWRDTVDCPKDFINVIEDARIEKLMKRKFPGLRKSFAGGYKELNDKDFFSIIGEDLNNFSLIDRINLHFKIGASAMIPFGASELVFVERTENAETFEEVLQIAADVFEFSQTEKVAEVSAAPNAEQGDTESEETTESTQESDEDQPQVVPQSGSNIPSGMDEEEEDDWDDEEEEEDAGDNGGTTSQTQRAFDDSAENLSSRQTGKNPIYVEIPESVDLEKHVVDWTEVHDWIDSQASSNPEVYEYVDARYYEFRKSSQKEVNYLVKEFECKKSADAYARAGQSKTGVLDTAKLHTYKYNEDLFKKVTVVPDGKNHGLIFLLDWSGSMANELLATVKQLLNLTAFCKKVQIPFEVYAFTNDWFVVNRIKEGNNDTYHDHDYSDVKKNMVYINGEWFHLMNMVSSRSNSRNYERMSKNLFREASAYRGGGYHPTHGLSLSGTPLNEAVIMLNYIIPQFKQENDLQKVNVCILSDGEGSCAAYGHEIYLDHKDEYSVRPRRLDYYQILRDRKTGRTYEQFEYDNVTNIFIKQVRDRNPDVNVLGFRVLPGSALQNFVGRYATYEGYSEIQKQWKKEKSAVIKNPKAFTALYAISNNALNETAEFNVESGAKKGDISRAFKKMLGNKSTNKKLLSSFVEYVS